MNRAMSILRTAQAIFRQGGARDLFRAVASRVGRKRMDYPEPIAWTEHLHWLSWANGGMLNGGNVDCFAYALQRLPSHAPLLEIGVFCGLSTNVLTYFKTTHHVANPLICCDPWAFEHPATATLHDHTTITQDELQEFVRATFVRNVRFFSGHDLPHPFQMTSDEFFRLWAEGGDRANIFGGTRRLGGPLSFCYIDGNHTYDFARRDFLNCDTYLEPGGFILFDDSAEGTNFEVCRLAREVRASGRYELIARKPNYFFRKK